MSIMNDQRTIATTSRDEEQEPEDDHIRDIHALTPPRPPSANRSRPWETNSHRSSSLSMASEGASSENFSSMSREFNALVLAGSTIANNGSEVDGTVNSSNNNLGRIGEEEIPEETNPLAIVPDPHPLGPLTSSPRREGASESLAHGNHREVSIQRVKKEEVESKINAWQTAKVAKVNNRFKREDAVISGWETEQVQKANSWMKKVERKLEEKRAKALEKMENDIAKARRKAEERRASAEGKRGTKVAKILEVANLMRAVGRAPVKRSFF
ncbi:remorin 4.1-like [Coffea eugenioides]|uniref:remorin 4.1-like n=1 Tax=Coffea eugenioides TaxID=49369 RepID=UPI000F60D8AD|nr:remorin 4.1-like [Coffea eugenioides]